MLETRNFLIPDATLIIEIIAFSIVLILMVKFVLPHIRRAMQQRQEQIAAALAAAAEAEPPHEAGRHTGATTLASARRQASEITDQARSMRDHLVAEGRRAGNGEYQWIAGRAEREAERRADARAAAGAAGGSGGRARRAPRRHRRGLRPCARRRPDRPAAPGAARER